MRKKGAVYVEFILIFNVLMMVIYFTYMLMLYVIATVQVYETAMNAARIVSHYNRQNPDMTQILSNSMPTPEKIETATDSMQLMCFDTFAAWGSPTKTDCSPNGLKNIIANTQWNQSNCANTMPMCIYGISTINGNANTIVHEIGVTINANFTMTKGFFTPAIKVTAAFPIEERGNHMYVTPPLQTFN